jgi:hypothetical protein
MWPRLQSLGLLNRLFPNLAVSHRVTANRKQRIFTNRSGVEGRMYARCGTPHCGVRDYRTPRTLTAEGKVFDLLLTPSAPDLPAKRVQISTQDWPTFALGDAVGYDTGRLWHKTLPDQPVEVEASD